MFNLTSLIRTACSCPDDLCSDNIREMLDLTWDYRDRWKFIGIKLGVDTPTLNTIKQDHQSSEDCLVELLNIWLRGDATRSAMARALQSRQVVIAGTSGQGIYACI